MFSQNNWKGCYAILKGLLSKHVFRHIVDQGHWEMVMAAGMVYRLWS